jgi:DNA-binding LacI/PurR family transcriptional regulator
MLRGVANDATTADGATAARRRDRVTIRDVAQLSGVSTATVTRALQGHPRVRPETRTRVEEAAVKLDYRPDSLARALATGASNTIGLVIPSTGDTFWGEVAEGLEERAGEAGFTLLLGLAHGDPQRERRVLDLFVEKRVDSIVIAAPAGNPRDWFGSRGVHQSLVLVSWDATEEPREFELAQQRPVGETIGALAGSGLAGPWFAHVSVDDVGGSTAVVRHLLGLGHERIALLAGPPLRPALLRLLGFRLGLEEAGIAPAAIVSCEETFEAGRRSATELLRSSDPPSAIVAYNDVIAIGAIRGAHELGLRVPEDVSIVGFDDIEFAAYVEPPLTTLRQPKREMGRLAMDLLLEGLGGRSGPIREILPGELVVRASTAMHADGAQDRA